MQISDHIPCCFAYKVVCIDYKFVKPAVLYRGKHAVNKFIEVILEEYDYFKNWSKNIIIKACHVEDKRRFPSSNKCWICNKLFTDKE